MSNTLTITGDLATSVSDTEEGYCVITGYLQDLQGVMQKGAYLTFRYLGYTSAISSTKIITKERMTARADTNGKVSIKLLQGAKVKVEIPGLTLDYKLECYVPASETADLVDILFPRVVSLAFDDDPLSLSVGDVETLQLTATLSDGQTLTASSQATLASSNDGIASLSGNVLEAESTGSATISISDLDIDSLEYRQKPNGDVIRVLEEASPDLTDTLSVVIT